MPETCETDFHVHHTHDQSGNERETTESYCHECTSHAHECGCTSPEVRFFKLINEITKDEVSFVKVEHVKISIAFLTILTSIQEITEIPKVVFYTDPPPKITTSKSFLIQVHQLKIPVSA